MAVITTFLNVLRVAPVDFKKVKVIVLMLDGYLHKQNRFLAEVQNQLQQSPYNDQFADNVTVANVAAGLQKEDYYNLDLHINATGHRKVADSLWRIIQSTR